MIPLAPLLSEFLQRHLPGERGASPATVASYSDCYRLFLTYAAEHLKCPPHQLCVEQLDASMVSKFLEHLESVRKNSPRSRNARLAAIRSFMAFAADRQPCLLDHVRRIHAIPVKKTDGKLITALNRPETQAIIDAPDSTTSLGLRDRALLLLAINCGLRASEIVGIELAHLDLREESIVSVMGKGKKQRVLPLWPTTSKALRAWIEQRKEHPSPKLFLNAQGRPLSRWGFSYIVRKYSARTSQPSSPTKRISPHILRHTCAMLLLESTHDLRKVALWLGHASIKTTECYTRADPATKLEISEAFVPFSLRRGKFSPSGRLLALLRPKPAPLCGAASGAA